ncbi:hypothetical protein BcDW1_450 [Botrytis cinerea BcDW1]|nr:hypothetical protein BcDW1_450 [Botrytis cinerea BcDW1]
MGSCRNYEDEIAQMALSEVLYDRRFTTFEGGTLILVPVMDMRGDAICWLNPDLITPFTLRRNVEPPANIENTIQYLSRRSLGDYEPPYLEYAFAGECHIDTPIYSHGQEPTHPAVKSPCSTQDDSFGENSSVNNHDYFGEEPIVNNHDTFEIFRVN